MNNKLNQKLRCEHYTVIFRLGITRSSHQRYSMKEGVFGNFTKNHTKTPMLESFLIKFAGLKPVT